MHSYIYAYISTYRPTFSVNPTCESKDQIGMAKGVEKLDQPELYHRTVWSGLNRGGGSSQKVERPNWGERERAPH